MIVNLQRFKLLLIEPQKLENFSTVNIIQDELEVRVGIWGIIPTVLCTPLWGIRDEAFL